MKKYLLVISLIRLSKPHWDVENVLCVNSIESIETIFEISIFVVFVDQ